MAGLRQTVAIAQRQPRAEPLNLALSPGRMPDGRQPVAKVTGPVIPSLPHQRLQTQAPGGRHVARRQFRLEATIPVLLDQSPPDQSPKV